MHEHCWYSVYAYYVTACFMNQLMQKYCVRAECKILEPKIVLCADAASRRRRSGFSGIHESPLLTTVLMRSARRSLSVPHSPKPVVVHQEATKDNASCKISYNENGINRPIVRRLRSILHHSEVSNSIKNSQTESQQSNEGKKKLTRFVIF
jgi:hypothetical protein